jgi:predicted nucleotidyltransferase
MPILGIIMPNMGILPRTTHTAPPAAQRRSRKTSSLPRTGLADALFTSTQQRLLGLLYGQPLRSFYATELIERTGSGSGAVQRELRRLSESGLINITRLGNQKHYQANASAPIFNELRGIVDKTVGSAGALLAALLPLEEQIRFAAIYGSLAKATDGAMSDIDVLIVAAGLTLERIYSALQPVEKRLGRSVNPTLYTPEEFQRRRATGQAFLRKVLGGPHITLIGSEDAARRTR